LISLNKLNWYLSYYTLSYQFKSLTDNLVIILDIIYI
jgi:hypothetical protein